MWEGGRQESDESERERRATECVLVVHTHRIRKIVSQLPAGLSFEFELTIV